MRIRELFNKSRENGKKLFIPYITCGDPDIDTSKEIVKELVKAGADIIELGVPFSDPLADGSVNQKSHERALANEVTIKDCCQFVKSLRDDDIVVPVILFTYYNPVYQFGIENLIDFAKDALIDAVLILDLPVEESTEIVKLLNENNIGIISLVAPTTTKERLKKIYATNPEFIYYISRTGVTGVSKNLAQDIDEKLEFLKEDSDLPIAVGFGIATPQQASQASRYADAVVMGSALVKELENPNITLAKENISKLASAVNKAIKG